MAARLKPRELQPGDCLRVGNLEFEFQLQAQPTPRRPGTLRTAPAPTPVPAPVEDYTLHYPDTPLGYSIIPYAIHGGQPLR